MGKWSYNVLQKGMIRIFNAGRWCKAVPHLFFSVGFVMASRQASGMDRHGFSCSVPLSIAGGQESRLFQTHGICFSENFECDHFSRPNYPNLASRGFDTCSYSITRMIIPIWPALLRSVETSMSHCGVQSDHTFVDHHSHEQSILYSSLCGIETHRS